MPTPDERSRSLVLHRPHVAASDGCPVRIRLAAIRSIQATLSLANPLRSQPPELLLEAVKPAWASRLVLHDGRGVDLKRLKAAFGQKDMRGY